MRTFLLALALLIVSSSRADADDGTNWLIGPVLGIRLGNHAGSSGVIGIEGGVGSGPQRLNLGFEHRDDKLFSYLEIDPWLLLGASLGFGVDSDGEPHPVIGVWEGMLIGGFGCSDKPDKQVTIAAGYRYTGVHELYVTAKAGVGQPACLNFN
jgi:hypothetical protein